MKTAYLKNISCPAFVLKCEEDSLPVYINTHVCTRQIQLERAAAIISSLLFSFTFVAGSGCQCIVSGWIWPHIWQLSFHLCTERAGLCFYRAPQTHLTKVGVWYAQGMQGQALQEICRNLIASALWELLLQGMNKQ